MARIHVTGNAGSGKSTLAAELGSALNLPVYGLDQVVWQQGWRKTPEDRRAALEAELITQPDWVIEGVSPAVRQAADIVIFLDVPRRTAYWRCLKRNLPYAFRSRPGLPPNCPEIRIAAHLCRLIWRFPTHVRPAILADVQGGEKRFLHVRTAQDLARALGKLGLRDPLIPPIASGGQWR